VPGDVLTLLCGRCRSVQRIELGVLERVPMWLSLLAEAFREAGVRAIRVQTCDVCRETPTSRDMRFVLAELKRTIEGR
jgi:hypothetical protein